MKPEKSLETDGQDCLELPLPDSVVIERKAQASKVYTHRIFFRKRMVLLILAALCAFYYPFNMPNILSSIPASDANVLPCHRGHAMKNAKELMETYNNNSLFLALKDYFWIKHNSSLRLPYGVKGSEMTLLSVLRKAYVSTIPENINRMQCKTCVVVGNGYSVINSSLGDLINLHNVVIRINNAPVKGYEKDVGNKTTMRFFYPESAQFDVAAEDPQALLVLVLFKELDLKWLKQNLNDEKRNRHGFWKLPPLIWNVDPSRVRILNPYFMYAANTLLLQPQIKATPNTKKYAYPTSGLLAVTIALHFCDVVHLTGFGYPHANETRVPVHYYDKVSIKSMSDSPHNIIVEKAILQKLENFGAVKFLKPHH